MHVGSLDLACHQGHILPLTSPWLPKPPSSLAGPCPALSPSPASWFPLQAPALIVTRRVVILIVMLWSGLLLYRTVVDLHLRHTKNNSCAIDINGVNYEWTSNHRLTLRLRLVLLPPPTLHHDIPLKVMI